MRGAYGGNHVKLEGGCVYNGGHRVIQPEVRCWHGGGVVQSGLDPSSVTNGVRKIGVGTVVSCITPLKSAFKRVEV